MGGEGSGAESEEGGVEEGNSKGELEEEGSEGGLEEEVPEGGLLLVGLEVGVRLRAPAIDRPSSLQRQPHASNKLVGVHLEGAATWLHMH